VEGLEKERRVVETFFKEIVDAPWISSRLNCIRGGHRARVCIPGAPSYFCLLQPYRFPKKRVPFVSVIPRRHADTRNEYRVKEMGKGI
jgi:hypothetical protein